MTNKRRLLHILGAGAWQVPTITLAKKLGYRVLVTDIYAERPGYQIADDHEVADISDADATLAVAERYKIDGIVCDTTDVGVTTMALVAEKLNLPGIGLATAKNFTNKGRMRKLSREAGLETPAFACVRHRSEMAAAVAQVGLPCVVKPTSAQSSRGVTVLRYMNGLDQAFFFARGAASEGEVIVEAFLPGKELTVEGYCENGRVHLVAVSDKEHLTKLPVVAHRLTYPADISTQQRAKLEELNRRTVEVLGLRNGIFHGEYIISEEKITLVEIAARGGGSHVYTDILPALANLPIPESYLRFVMGEGWRHGDRLAERAPPQAANLAFFQFPAGLVEGIRGLDRAKSIMGVHRLLIELTPGQLIEPVSDDRSRHGLVLIFGSDRAEVLKKAECVYDAVEVKIDGVWHKGNPAG